MDKEDILNRNIKWSAITVFAVLIALVFYGFDRAMKADMEYLCKSGVVYDDKCS